MTQRTFTTNGKHKTKRRVCQVTPDACDHCTAYGKSVHKERMAENPAVFNFALSDGGMTAIAGLDQGTNLFFSHYDSEIVSWLAGLGK